MGYWDKKRVTVTGGAGFLGSHIVEHLSSLGSDVFVPRSSGYDLTISHNARRMYEDSNPQVVIHLAARVGGIGANALNPGRFFYENMAMGLNVIEEARLHGGVDKLVVTGTACSYPNVTPVPFREESLWNGYPEETNAPYGVAKLALETMGRAYRSQYGMNIIYLIPTNLYGCGDNFDPASSHVVPALIRKFVEGREQASPGVQVWGTGSASREFLFAPDAAEGIVLAAEHYNETGAVNLGTGVEVTIRELAGLISRLVRYEGEILWDSSRPDGQPRRSLDTTRAKNAFGFVSRTSLQEGLKQTIDWFLGERAS